MTPPGVKALWGLLHGKTASSPTLPISRCLLFTEKKKYSDTRNSAFQPSQADVCSQDKPAVLALAQGKFGYSPYSRGGSRNHRRVWPAGPTVPSPVAAERRAKPCRSSPGAARAADPAGCPASRGGAGLEEIPTGWSSGDRAAPPSAAASATTERGQGTPKRFQTTFCLLFCCCPRVLGLASHFAVLGPANTWANSPQGPSCKELGAKPRDEERGSHRDKEHAAAGPERHGYAKAPPLPDPFQRCQKQQGAIARDNGSRTGTSRARLKISAGRGRCAQEAAAAAERAPRERRAGPGGSRAPRRSRPAARGGSGSGRAHTDSPAGRGARSPPPSPQHRARGGAAPSAAPGGKEGGGRESLTVGRW